MREIQRKYQKAKAKLEAKREQYQVKLENKDLENMSFEEEVELETEIRKELNMIETEKQERETKKELINNFLNHAENTTQIKNNINIKELKEGLKMPSIRKRIVELALKV